MDDAPSVVDVTVALQCLVEKSTLSLHKDSSKSSLNGFYDPCPEEVGKSLRVRYSFQGRMHEVTVDDKAALKCPSKHHIVQ